MDTSEENPRTDSGDEIDLNNMEFSVLDECGTDEDDENKDDNSATRDKNDPKHKGRRSVGKREKREYSHKRSPTSLGRRNIMSSNDRSRSLRSSSKGKRSLEHSRKDHRYNDKPYTKEDHSKERKSRSRSVQSTSSHDCHSSRRKMEIKTTCDTRQKDKQKERQKSQSSMRNKGQEKVTHLRDRSNDVRDKMSDNKKSRHGTPSKPVGDKRQKDTNDRRGGRNSSAEIGTSHGKSQKPEFESGPLSGFQVIDDDDEDDDEDDDGIEIQIDDSLVETMDTHHAGVYGMVVIEDFHTEKERKQKKDEKTRVSGNKSKQENEKKERVEEKECFSDKSMPSLSVTNIINDTEEVSETEEFLSVDELEDFTVLDDLVDERSDEDDMHITVDDSIVEDFKLTKQETIDEEMVDINLYVKDEITEEDKSTNKTEIDLVVVQPSISQKERAKIRKRGDDPAMIKVLLSKNIADIEDREKKFAVTEDLVPVELYKEESIKSNELKNDCERIENIKSKIVPTNEIVQGKIQYDDLHKERQLNDNSGNTNGIEIEAIENLSDCNKVTGTEGKVLVQNVTDTKKEDLMQDVTHTKDILKDASAAVEGDVKKGVTPSVTEEGDKPSHPGDKGLKQIDPAKDHNVLTQGVTDTEDIMEDIGNAMERDEQQGITHCVIKEKDKPSNPGEKKNLTQGVTDTEEKNLTQKVTDIHFRDITQNDIATDKQYLTHDVADTVCTNRTQDVIDLEEQNVTRDFTDSKEQNMTQHSSLIVLDFLPEDDDINKSIVSQSNAESQKVKKQQIQLDQNMSQNTNHPIFQTFEAIEQIAKTMEMEYSVDEVDNNTAIDKTKTDISHDANLGLGEKFNLEQLEEVDSGDILYVNESIQSEAVPQNKIFKDNRIDLHVKTDATYPKTKSSKDFPNKKTLDDLKIENAGMVHSDRVNNLSDVCCEDSQKLENILSNSAEKSKTENIVLVHDENIDIHVDKSTDNVTLKDITDINDNESTDKNTSSCTRVDGNRVLLNEMKLDSSASKTKSGSEDTENVILRNVSDAVVHGEVENVDDSVMLVAKQLKYIKDDHDKNEEGNEAVGEIDIENISEIMRDTDEQVGLGDEKRRLVDETACVDKELNFINEDGISDNVTGDVDIQLEYENVDIVGFVDEDVKLVDEVIGNARDKENIVVGESEDRDRVEDVQDDEIEGEDLEAIDNNEEEDAEVVDADKTKIEDADEDVGDEDEHAFQVMMESEGITENKGLVMVDEVGDIDDVEFLEASSSNSPYHDDRTTKAFKKPERKGLSQKPKTQKRPVTDHKASLKEKRERQMRGNSTKDNIDHNPGMIRSS